MVNLENSEYTGWEIDDDVSTDENLLSDMNQYLDFYCNEEKLEFILCCCYQVCHIDMKIFDTDYIQKYKGRIRDDPKVEFYMVLDPDTEKKLYRYITSEDLKFEMTKEAFFEDLRTT